MARKLRVQYPRAIYRVINRGDRRERSTRLSDEQPSPSGRRNSARELGAADAALLGVYTNRFNHRDKEFGHLLSGRCKTLLVYGSGNGYLKAVCEYVPEFICIGQG